MTQEERIKNFVTKARMIGAGDFEVDPKKSVLLECKTQDHKKYGRLELPPVKMILENALYGIEAEELIIPDTITHIELSSFDRCSADIVTIQGNIVKVKFECNYSGIFGVKTINIGKNVKDRAIVDLAFFVDGLEAINVSEDNPWYASDNGILYNKDFTELLHYPSEHPQKVYIMPNTVKGTIKQETLRKISHLEKLKISDNVTELEPAAIYDCENLEEIELGQSLEVIDIASFARLRSLDKLKTNGALEIVNIAHLDF